VQPFSHQTSSEANRSRIEERRPCDHRVQCSPTTTTNLAKQTLEKISKLKVEEDFGLAFSPERVYEGRVLEDIKTRYPKVVGGIGQRSAEATAALYEVIAQKGIMKVTSPTEAETSKLFEGIYRDVNIALANELARFCGAMGVDFKEVREAANSQPFCHLHLPGFVGGLCIPFYPYFVLQVAKEEGSKLPLTSLARRINEDKPQLLVKVADETLRKVRGNGLRGSKVAILGLSFRGDVADTRNSASYEVIDSLLKKGVSRITAYDPFINEDKSLREKGVDLATNTNEAAKDADLLLIMTDHSSFKSNLSPRELVKTASIPVVLIDGRNILHVNSASIARDNFAYTVVEGFQILIRLTG